MTVSGIELAWEALLAAAVGDTSGAAARGLETGPDGDWRDQWARDPAPADLISLYLPFIQPSRGCDSCVIGHLGQSLDGCVATATGDACYVTCEANIVHLHRMRALADAVIVGASTVAADDPQLTTRLVPGPSPARVVIDPRARLSMRQRLFHDGACPTLVCVREGRRHRRMPDSVEYLTLSAPALGTAADPGGEQESAIDLEALCHALRARGLRRLFVEGGGITVSNFLRAGLLDRLQLTVAPVLIGRGRRGIDLPSVHRLADALRPVARRYRMGDDILYDLSFSGRSASDGRCDDVPGGGSNQTPGPPDVSISRIH